jgi:hypothetical protein
MPQIQDPNLCSRHKAASTFKVNPNIAPCIERVMTTNNSIIYNNFNLKLEITTIISYRLLKFLFTNRH